MSPPPDVDLRDLRIEETATASGGRKLLVIVLVILLLALAFGAGWWLGGGGTTLGGRIAVRVETVRADGGRGARPGDYRDGGWIEVPSYHPVVVSALVPGRVEDLLVLEGSPVTPNQVVARLYAKDREDELRRAEAAVREAQAALDLFTAGYRREDVEKARADAQRVEEEVRLAEKVLARTRTLVPEGVASQEDLDRDAAAAEVARARHAGARQELARLEAGFRKEEVEGARAKLEKAKADRDLAEAQLSYCVVRSPVNGVVLERFVTPGSWVGAANPRVVALYDPEDLQARVDVRLENADRVRVGQKVEIRTDAEPDRTYHGVVIRLEPLADFKKNTIQAKIRIEDPESGLHPEMTCKVRFLAEGTEPSATEARRLTVSSTAIVRESGRTYVYVVQEDRARRVEVRLGETRDGSVVVESGVEAGDRVVLDPPAGLGEEASVEVNTP